jgi:cob(I)alamin adenosyltransferase
MKVVSLIANEQRKAKAETSAELEALTKDFYAALEPLRKGITDLQADVAALMAISRSAQRQISELRRDVDKLMGQLP